MTRSLSSLLSANSEYRNQQHIHFQCRQFTDVRTFNPDDKLSEFCFVRSIYFHHKSMHSNVCSDACHSPFTLTLLFVVLPYDLGFPFVLSFSFSRDGEWCEKGKWTEGGAEHREFAGCFLEVCFQFEPCSVMQREASEQFAPVTYLLSCLFAISCSWSYSWSPDRNYACIKNTGHVWSL